MLCRFRRECKTVLREEVTVKRFVFCCAFRAVVAVPGPNFLHGTFVTVGMIPPATIPEPIWKTVPTEAQAAISALVGSLEQRIAELEAENAELRRRREQLEHELQEDSPAQEAHTERPQRPQSDPHGPASQGTSQAPGVLST
jgi:TolA-binding protein